MLLVANPMVEAYITKGFWNSLLKKWKKKYGMKIKTESSSSMDFLSYQFFDENGEEITV